MQSREIRRHPLLGQSPWLFVRVGSAGGLRRGGALCAHCSCRSDTLGRSHGVSDPSGRAGNRPARVRRGRHAIAVGVIVAVGEGWVRIQLRQSSAEKCGPIVVHFVGTIWSRSCGNPDRLGTDPARLCSRLLRVRGGAIVVRFGVRSMATSASGTDRPTITQSMLDPCSAPCKARRFAPPAPTRGLRALTVPARIRFSQLRDRPTEGVASEETRTARSAQLHQAATGSSTNA